MTFECDRRIYIINLSSLFLCTPFTPLTVIAFNCLYFFLMGIPVVKSIRHHLLAKGWIVTSIDHDVSLLSFSMYEWMIYPLSSLFNQIPQHAPFMNYTGLWLAVCKTCYSRVHFYQSPIRRIYFQKTIS